MRKPQIGFMDIGKHMYQVWHSKGHGLMTGPRFRRLADAIRHAGRERSQSSSAIMMPNGDWYVWPSIGRAILPRRDRSRARSIAGDLAA